VMPALEYGVGSSWPSAKASPASSPDGMLNSGWQPVPG
jgi:hypothetical protein